MSDDSWNRIRAHLERQGHMTADGISRKVKARTCRSCHAPVLTGYDGDLVARPCTVDPTPLSALGEALAVLAGRYTLALRRAGNRYEMNNRDQWSIAGSPAGTKNYDVVAEHRCSSPPLPSAPSAHQPRAVSATPTAPPF